MKKQFRIIILVLMLIALVVALLVSCGSNPSTTVADNDIKEDVTAVDEGTVPSEDSALDSIKADKPAETKPVEPTAPAVTVKPTVADSATAPAPATPAATPKPAQTHTHSWTPVTRTVHHEAVTEQVKVIDQPATEGWLEQGSSYGVYVCSCGAKFPDSTSLIAHSKPFILDSIPGHGSSRTETVYNDPIWHEGTPEVSHYETRVVRDAWDETITSYICACGATA